MKVAILTAAILSAAVTHSVFASTVAEREYQRGYDDCRHGRYDQDQHGESYKKGCRAAEDHPQTHSPAAQKDTATTKHASHAKVSDLKGMNSIKAIDVMTSRGFTSVDSITSGDTLYGIYYNAKTHQCIQLTNANNHVVSVDDIGKHPNCN
ncbi:hypothetical protein CCR95_09975 [Thiocystis minor]|uniref:hypothetical protein n=1 Tax=Thiocystis minor TaxID=61597 RepID=UPI0019149728|nr:hypothetical protein [Thiocystis minor]MBK5964402.1 hypothetical protein [Thiocystis minor]